MQKILIIIGCMLIAGLSNVYAGTVTDQDLVRKLTTVWVKNDVNKNLDWTLSHTSVSGTGLEMDDDDNLIGLNLNGFGLYEKLVIVEMEHLQYFDVSNNVLSDIVFGSLPKVEWIDISHNTISFWATNFGNEDVKSLKKLTAHHNQIQSLKTIQNFSGLEILDLSFNRLEKLNGLGNLTTLRELHLNNNYINDFDEVAKLIGLEYLDIGNMGIIHDNLDFLQSLPKLKYLGLQGARISELGNLTNLTSLTGLDLSGIGTIENGVRRTPADLSVLDKLSNLEQLALAKGIYKDITVLQNMPKLTVLDLSENQLSDISPLAVLKNLTELDLHYNYVSDIKPLSGLKKLQKLDLSRNGILDVTPLSGLTELKELNLAGNGISDISALKALPGLEQVNLAGNCLTMHQLAEVAAPQVELGYQWGVYFVKRVQYLPVCNYYDVPKEELVINGVPSKVRVVTQSEEFENMVDADGASFDPATGRVTFHQPGEYHIWVTNPVVAAKDSFDFSYYSDVDATRVSSGLINVVNELPTGEWGVNDDNRHLFDEVLQALRQQGFVQADTPAHKLYHLLMMLYEEYCC